MKKTLLVIATMFVAITASAQFEMSKAYIGAGLTGFDFNYSGGSKVNLGVGAKAGLFLEDDWLILGTVDFQHNGHKNTSDVISAGVGTRYYIEQNGIFLGANAQFIHAFRNYNDVLPGVEVGYAYFINGSVTIEPSIYYNQSFKDHANYSTIGFKIGLGIYL